MLRCGLGGPQNTGESMDIVTWTPERVEQLLANYIERIGRDFGAVLPAADSVAH